MSFRDNAAKRRYEWEEEGHISFADYRDAADIRLITHVETPLEARGRGHAAKLMAAIVEAARADGPKLRGACSYAAAYFRRHPDTADVQA